MQHSSRESVQSFWTLLECAADVVRARTAGTARSCGHGAGRAGAAPVVRARPADLVLNLAVNGVRARETSDGGAGAGTLRGAPGRIA
jgi:hypothetical protein